MARTAESRQGSAMSAKQMAYSAVHGRKVTCQFLRGASNMLVTGYVIGADDYHWLIASPEDRPAPVQDDPPADPKVKVTLVAKGRVDVVVLSPESTLDDEPSATRIVIEEMGRGFRSFCARTFFGGSAEPEEQES